MGKELLKARTTVSKYVYVKNTKTGKRVKVRFSNHMPNKELQLNNDCDFYVGRSHEGTITTEQVIPEVIKRLDQ